MIPHLRKISNGQKHFGPGNVPGTLCCLLCPRADGTLYYQALDWTSLEGHIRSGHHKNKVWWLEEEEKKAARGLCAPCNSEDPEYHHKPKTRRKADTRRNTREYSPETDRRKTEEGRRDRNERDRRHAQRKQQYDPYNRRQGQGGKRSGRIAHLSQQERRRNTNENHGNHVRSDGTYSRLPQSTHSDASAPHSSSYGHQDSYASATSRDSYSVSRRHAYESATTQDSHQVRHECSYGSASSQSSYAPADRPGFDYSRPISSEVRHNYASSASASSYQPPINQV
jgi:hypothetical protein